MGSNSLKAAIYNTHDGSSKNSDKITNCPDQYIKSNAAVLNNENTRSIVRTTVSFNKKIGFYN